MAIIISGRIKLPKEDAKNALIGAKEYIADALTEPGCLAYNWSLDPNEEGVIYVFEEWAEPQDLALHFSAPSYINMLTHLGQYELLEVDTRKHLVTKHGPVYDGENPSANFS